MPNPIWSFEYDFADSPEGNNFTRNLYNNPTINEVKSGGNKRVEINATNGDCVFVSSFVPAIDSNTGITAECMVNVSGNAGGDAGIEITFLSHAILMQVYPNQVFIGLTGDLQTLEYFIPTASNNSDLLYRVTCSGSGSGTEVNVYRAGTHVGGPYTPPTLTRAYQRFLWWGESGIVSTWKQLKYYLGGPVTPG